MSFVLQSSPCTYRFVVCAAAHIFMFPATLYQLYPSILPAQTNPLPSPARTQTTLLFAQCVYLMFAGVYVAKEAVEHILLSAGHGHGHGRPSPSLPSAASTLASNASLNAAEGITRGLGLHGAGEMGNDGHHHHWGDERPEMLGCVFSSLVCFGEAYGFLVLFWSSIFLLLVRGICVASHTMPILPTPTTSYTDCVTPSVSLSWSSSPSSLLPLRLSIMMC